MIPINYALAAFHVRQIMTKTKTQVPMSSEQRVQSALACLVAQFSLTKTQAVKFVYSYLKEANESARAR